MIPKEACGKGYFNCEGHTDTVAEDYMNTRSAGTIECSGHGDGKNSCTGYGWSNTREGGASTYGFSECDGYGLGDCIEHDNVDFRWNNP